MSRKQSKIIEFMKSRETATFNEISTTLYEYYYTNYKHHISNIINKMVLKGLLVRVSRGVYKLGSAPETKKEQQTICKNQIKMDLDQNKKVKK